MPFIHVTCQPIAGHSASIEVWDSRVEFSQLSFINSHGNGITFASLMHVRFIASAATVPVLYPLTALRGHTVSGNELVLTRTGAVFGSSNLKWCENADSKCVDSKYGYSTRTLYPV